MDGNIGIRLVKTKETSIGLATHTPALSGGQSAAGCAALAVNSDASPANDVSCQPITDAVNFLAAGTIPCRYEQRLHRCPAEPEPALAPAG